MRGHVYVDETSNVAVYNLNPIQKIFDASGTLPAHSNGVTIRNDDGSTASLSAGNAIPATMDGWIIVDDISGETKFIDGALPTTSMILGQIGEVHADGLAALPDVERVGNSQRAFLLSHIDCTLSEAGSTNTVVAVSIDGSTAEDSITITGSSTVGTSTSVTGTVYAAGTYFQSVVTTAGTGAKGLVVQLWGRFI